MRKTSASFLLILTLVLISPSLALAQVFALPEQLSVISAPGVQLMPRTDGHSVVWTDYRDGWDNPKVYGARLSDGREFPIAVNSQEQNFPDVDGDNVAWNQSQSGRGSRREVRAKNLSTGKEYLVSDPKADSVQPRISGDWVVWIAGRSSVVARNISTMEPSIVLNEGNSRPVSWAAIDGNRVVWLDEEPFSGGIVTNRLLMAEIGTSGSRVLAERKGARGDGIDVRGDLVAYCLGFELNITNIETEQTIQPFDYRERPTNRPTTDGRYVFVDDFAIFHKTEGRQIDLIGYDTLSGAILPIVANNGYNTTSSTRGGVLVWAGGPNEDNTDIKIASVAEFLPTAAEPVAPSTPDRAYFSETKHTVAYGFKYFWDHSGGLPVFGFPLTKEYSEFNADSGKYFTVQYLERQRFEYHPEFKGTPYETSLGRLGVQDAADKGLSTSAAFARQSQDSPNTATRVFSAETGHWLSGAFLDYWKGHGLEFGDRGISYRESLALFGYPISEEFVDPQTGLVTQYFERAVFEYHPNNPDPYKVLLRRLGADTVTARQW